MAFPDGYRLTLLDDPTRLDDLLRLDVWAFPVGESFEDLRAGMPPIPWGRMWAIEPTEADVSGDREFVGMAGAHGLRSFPVPGAEVACGWLTWVCVHPGHRRRGLLRGLIANHLADCLERGEAISGLTATEGAIYGRFGYGSASTEMAISVPRGAALRPVRGADRLSVRIHEWQAEQHGAIVADLHRAYARVPEGLGRPGWSTWETPELRAVTEADPPALRGGKEPERLVLVSDETDVPRRYARFTRQLDWDPHHNPVGTVAVRDAVALDAPTAHRLWSVLLDLDLTASIEASRLTSDDPILSLLVNPRAAKPRIYDQQWIRILDLPRALAERRYAAPVDVVLEVADADLPANAGRWRVTADAWGYAQVSRTDATPELVLDIRELGAAHLGSVSLAALAQAGLVEVRDTGALARAAAAWSWPIAAGASWVF